MSRTTRQLLIFGIALWAVSSMVKLKALTRTRRALAQSGNE
jgi:hypothetical protein